jgi:4-amino-4-deoxychorismate lyase
MFPLLESIRIADGKIENLAAHQSRVEQSCKQLYLKPPSWQIGALVKNAQLPGTGIHKLRIVYDQEHAEWTVSPYTIKPVVTLKVVVADDVRYSHKFADRTVLDGLYAQRGEKDDILIVKDGMVTDTSYANIIFRRKGKWYTPTTHLLNGTMRQWLISRGVVEAIPISCESLPDFEEFNLINAMLRMDASPSDVSNIS